MHKLEESIRYTSGIPPQTVATSGNGIGVRLRKYNSFALSCQAALSTAGAAVVFYIAQSTDNATYSTSYLATCTLAVSTTVARQDVIEVRAEQLSDGYTYVRGEYTATATNTYQFIAAGNLQFNARFEQATLATT